MKGTINYSNSEPYYLEKYFILLEVEDRQNLRAMSFGKLLHQNLQSDYVEIITHGNSFRFPHVKMPHLLTDKI